MLFGAQLTNYLCTWDDTLVTLRAVEDGHWNSLWWSDHFLVPVPRSEYVNKEALDVEDRAVRSLACRQGHRHQARIPRGQ